VDPNHAVQNDFQRPWGSQAHGRFYQHRHQDHQQRAAVRPNQIGDKF
jgi:hypothetical protein